MHVATRVLAPAALAGILTSTPAAQPAAWTRLDGLHAAALRTAAVASDGTLLAGTHVGVLRNAGSGWATVAGAVNGSIHDIATAPGGRVWVGTSGALRSNDGGATWQWFSIRTAPHSGTHPTVLHVSQAPSGVAFAGGYRTPDAGASWPQMSLYAYATAFVGSTAWAGTPAGVHRSVDGGGTWVPSGLDGFPVSHMVATGTRLVAATDSGILISDDGQNWIATCTLPEVSGLAVGGDGAVWAASPGGLYRSSDGQTWPLEPTAFAGLEVDDVAATGTTVLALVEGNPHRSTDSGDSWTEVHDGLGMPFATTALAAGGVLAVAANGAGIYRSIDAGVTWTRWNDGLASLTVRQMFASGDAGVAYAQTHDSIYRASLSDSGTWTQLSLPGGVDASGLTVDGTTLIALAAGPSFEGRIYRSTDGGASWTLVRTEPESFQPGIAANGGVAVVTAVGFTLPPRLLVSTDGGASWIERPHPTSPTFGMSPPVFVDGAGRLYVQDENQLVRSADLGQTWSTLGPAGAAENRATALHSEAGALCLGTLAGVWCSVDDGATFSPASAGLPGGGGVQIVALARSDTRYLALTSDDGVFMSDAVVAGAPQPSAETFALAVAPNPAQERADITLVLDAARDVRVEVFDVLGRRVAALHDGPMGAGVHVLTFNATTIPAGVYTVRAAGAGFAATRPVVLR